jgi:hypothetical protein
LTAALVGGMVYACAGNGTSVGVAWWAVSMLCMAGCMSMFLAAQLNYHRTLCGLAGWLFLGYYSLLKHIIGTDFDAIPDAEYRSLSSTGGTDGDGLICFPLF